MANITITTPPASPHAWALAHLKLKLAEVAGPDGSYLYADMGFNGALDALLSEANTSSLTSVGEIQFKTDGLKKSRIVDVLYIPRQSTALVTSNNNFCTPQPCNTNVYKADRFVLDRTRTVCFNLPRWEMQELVNGFAEMESAPMTVQQLANMPFQPDLTGILAGTFRENLRVLREAVNDDIAAQLAVAAPTFIAPGPGVPPPVPINITFTDANGNKVWPAALMQMGEFMDRMGMQDAIILYGYSPFYRALRLMQDAYTDANADGVDLLKLSTTYGSRINRGRVTPFFDLKWNQTFGQNEFLAWQKGSIRVYSFAEYDDGATGLVRYGYGTPGATTWKFALPDPIHGDKFMYDVRVDYVDCPPDSTYNLEGTYKVTIRATYGLWLYPGDIWPNGHPLFQTRRILWFKANAADVCLPICP